MTCAFPTTLETKIGQMCFVGFEGLEAPEYLLSWLREGRVGGVILFARNVQSPTQLAALTDSLQAAATYGVIVSIDQEGGTVARLRQGFTESIGAMALACTDKAEYYTGHSSRVLGEEMRALGIHWTYAPVVDISYNAENPSVGTRAFGKDVAQVSKLAAAAIRGFQSAGIAATAKHFPGLGDTAIDTHVALPALDTPVDRLIAHDLDPYRAAIGENVASVMITHVMYTALDADYPATLSPVLVKRLLREVLKFDGVVSTDCLEMHAISKHYTPAETAILAALAGSDTILFSHTRAVQEEAYQALISAAQSGRLPLSVIDEANRRLFAFKTRYLKPRTDLSVIRAPSHLDAMAAAARASVVMLKRGAALPLHGTIGIVEFPSLHESGIIETSGLTGLAQRLKARLPHLEVVIQQSNAEAANAEQLAARVDTLILAVRNAHLSQPQLTIARRLLSMAHRVVLVCLRNPYDAGVLNGADTILLTCGDSTPSVAAAADALLGDFEPSGVLPVQIVGAR
ncbi:MAG: beta-N-acetylhexosaminidase [Anaerolineae bacterium]